MCSPEMILGGLAMGAGNYLQSSAQNDALENQQRAINASLEQQDQYSRQAENTAMENAQNYDPTKRTQEFENSRESAAQSLTNKLLESREAAPQVESTAGRMSQTFLTGENEAKQNQLDKSISMAQLMGRMRGASDLLTDEGYRNADYASRLGIIGRNAAGSYNAAQPGIISAGKVNNGSMLAGGILSGVGGSAMSAGLGNSLGSMNPDWMAPGTSPVGPTRGFLRSMF